MSFPVLLQHLGPLHLLIPLVGVMFEMACGCTLLAVAVKTKYFLRYYIARDFI